MEIQFTFGSSDTVAQIVNPQTRSWSWQVAHLWMECCSTLQVTKHL